MAVGPIAAESATDVDIASRSAITLIFYHWEAYLSKLHLALRDPTYCLTIKLGREFRGGLTKASVTFLVRRCLRFESIAIAHQDSALVGDWK